MSLLNSVDGAVKAFEIFSIIQNVGDPASVYFNRLTNNIKVAGRDYSPKFCEEFIANYDSSTPEEYIHEDVDFYLSLVMERRIKGRK